MNIKFNYLYRDHSNYKNFNEITFPNPNGILIEEIEATIKNHLIEGTWFYSTEWKVPDLHFENWDSEDDHFLHEFDFVEETEESPNAEMTIDSFLEVIYKARSRFI